MRKYDIVYVLKHGAGSKELRFSLRSVEENLNHGAVWFYGGKPAGIEPDEYVRYYQRGVNKFERVRDTLTAICKNDEITKKFWLFNDDFYVLEKMQSTEPLYQGMIHDHALNVESRHGNRVTSYTKLLRECEEILKGADLPTLDYALHVPLLVERETMLKALEEFPDCPMVRNLYGNYAKLGGVFHEDVKTTDARFVIPEGRDYLSTSDAALSGPLLEQMRERFPEPCRYEVDRNG